MVTAGDILALAEELADRADEASLRCAASRAYYAAFMHCVAIASRDLSFRARRLAQDHRLLREAIERSRQDIADFLDVLRLERNRADYDVGGQFLASSAADACYSARIVLTTYR